MNLKQWYLLEDKTLFRSKTVYENTMFPEDMFLSKVLYFGNGGLLIYYYKSQFHLYYMNGIKFYTFNWSYPVTMWTTTNKDQLVVISGDRLFRLNLFGHQVEPTIFLKIVSIRVSI